MEYIYFPIKVRETHRSPSACVAPPTQPHPAGNRISAPDLLGIAILLPFIDRTMICTNQKGFRTLNWRHNGN